MLNKKNIKIGYIGLGKMGFNMAERLLEKEYELVVFDKNKKSLQEIRKLGANSVNSLELLIKELNKPKIIWLMIPYQAVDSVLAEILPLLKKEDLVIDGGNSPYKDSIRRAQKLEKKGINFLDVGVSGGPDGARNGACVMVGGKKDVYKKYENIFKDISAPEAYGYMGESGAGHFVKMVHNGIEYGMMQAIAEGFSIMKNSQFKLNLSEVARVYNERSVIESRLVGWLKKAYKEYGEDLVEISGSVAHTGEGKWTVEVARKFGVPAPIIEGALNFRDKSQNNPSYTGKIVSALRGQFGHHEVRKKNK